MSCLGASPLTCSMQWWPMQLMLAVKAGAPAGLIKLLLEGERPDAQVRQQGV